MQKLSAIIVTAVSLSLPVHGNAADVYAGQELSLPEPPRSFTLYNTDALSRQQRHLALRESLARIDQNVAYTQREACRAGVLLEQAIDQHKFFGNLPARNKERFDRRIAACGEG